MRRKGAGNATPRRTEFHPRPGRDSRARGDAHRLDECGPGTIEATEALKALEALEAFEKRFQRLGGLAVVLQQPPTSSL